MIMYHLITCWFSIVNVLDMHCIHPNVLLVEKSKDTSQSSVGAYVGGCVGAAIVVVLALVGLVFYRRRLSS